MSVDILGTSCDQCRARFNKSLRPRKPEGSLGRTAQDVHLDSHTAPELCGDTVFGMDLYRSTVFGATSIVATSAGETFFGSRKLVASDIRMQKDHIRTLKILWSNSQFGGL